MQSALHTQQLLLPNCKLALGRHLRRPAAPLRARKAATRRAVTASAFEPDMSPLPVVYGTKGKVDILIDPTIYPARFADLDQGGACYFTYPNLSIASVVRSPQRSTAMIAARQAVANRQ